MKKQVGMGMLAVTLLLSACNEEAAQAPGETDTSSEPQVEEGTTEVEETDGENEERIEEEPQPAEENEAATEPLSEDVREALEKEAAIGQMEPVHSTPEEIDGSVKDVIASGHEVMITYNERRGWENPETVDHLMQEMATLMPEIEEAMDIIEDTALLEDFYRMHRVASTFINSIENDELDELEWRSRTSELRNIYRDLDYYVRGSEHYEPPNVTRYAQTRLNLMMQEDDVQEDLQQLSQATQTMIENAPNWYKEPFIQNSDFRQAIVRADGEKEDLSLEDIDYLLNQLESGNVTADEAVERFLE
jgi:hypothetical protein